MTQPMRAIALPEPNYPLLVNVFTANLVPSKPGGADNLSPSNPDAVLHWAISLAHPIVPGMQIMRMYLDVDSVDVYSRSADGMTCMRDTIPMRHVRVAQEGMPPAVFEREIINAESGDDEEIPDDESDPDEEQTSISTANGQTTA